MKTTSLSQSRTLVLTIVVLTLALSACGVIIAEETDKSPAVDVIFTATDAIMALTVDQKENVYAVTIEGDVFKIAPDGKSEGLYSGLETCGFSLPNVAALPNGDIVVNDCVDKKDTLIRIDAAGNATTLMQLEEHLRSMTADASGNIYLGFWLSEGNITVGGGNLERADKMWGQVSVLDQAGTLNTVYEGGIPFSLAASKGGELYAALWGQKGRFGPEERDYHICGPKNHFWIFLTDQVEIRQLARDQQSLTSELNGVSYVTIVGQDHILAFGESKEGECGIYQIKSGQNPGRLAVTQDNVDENITALVASDDNLYFSDKDGNVYRARLKGLVATEKVSKRPGEPSPTPAFTQPPPTSTATSTQSPTKTPVPPTASVTPSPTATTPPVVSVMDTPGPTFTPVPPSLTPAPLINIQVTQLALYEDAANHFAWSPDGQLLLIAGHNMHLYDVSTLQKTQEIDAGSVGGNVVFAPDGSTLASASYDGVRLWDTKGWGVLRTFAGSQGTDSVAFAPDGTMLASATGNTVKLWDVASGDELRTLPAGGPVHTVAFSPDGQTLAASGGVAGQDIKLWDVESGDELLTLTGHSNWINIVVFAPDGQTLASGSVDGTLRLWDVSDGHQLRVFSGHTNDVTSVAFAPDGRLLASASWDLTVKLWDVASGNELSSLTGHARTVNWVAFSPDGTMLASGSNDQMRLWSIQWDVASPEPVPTRAPALPTSTPVPLSELAISPDNAEQVTQLALLDADWVKQLVWSPDGSLLAIGTYHIYFYDAQTLEQVHVIDAIQWASGIAFSPDGSILASASYDGVKLWDVGGWGELRTFAGSRETESVAFAPDGTLLATATGNTVKLWDVSSGDELRTLPAGGSVRTVAFSPDGQTLAASGGVAGHDIKLWDVESGDELLTLTGHGNWINSIVFSPVVRSDGQTLASGAVDGTVRLWDVADGRQLRTFSGHTDQVEGVVFSPDGRLLASVSWDLTVKLWDVESGDELRSLTGHTGWMASVAFSPDGAVLASGANDSAVRLWGLETP